MATSDSFRAATSRWLWVITVALLCFGGLMIAMAWLLAWRDSEIPKQWGEYQGSHGPWRYYHPGKEFVWAALEAPFYALVVAAIAYLVRPSTKGAMLIGICLWSLFLVISTHYWLVD